MFPLETEAVQQIAYFLVLVSFAVYVVIGYLVAPKDNRIDTYLRFRKDPKPGQPTSSSQDVFERPELLASLMATAFSLASALYVYVQWTPEVKLFALWSP